MKNKKDNIFYGGITKEEMNIAEYPLTLLSKRIPKGVKTIEYNDWVTINGKQVPLSWVVTGSDKYGLPTAEDQDFFIAIMKVWHNEGFKERIIPIKSIYAILKEMSLPTTKQYYERFRLSLDRLTGLYISAKNAFWDYKKKCYLSDVKFHIFDECRIIYDRFNIKITTEPLPLSYIKVNEFFYESVRSGYLKNLDFTLYLKLPDAVTRKLYRYLDKKRHHGQTFSINIYKLAGKIGLICEKYYPSQLIRLIAPALEILTYEDFLKEYSFKNEILTVVFTESAGANNGNSKMNDKDSEIEFLVENILEVTGDKKSEGFYRMVAAKCPEATIYRVLSEVKEADRTSDVKNKGALFTYYIQKYSEE